MKNLAQRFLTEQELERIESAVTKAEKKTAGEIVCMIESSSYAYPMANVIGAAVLGLPLSLLAAPLLGGLLWLGTNNMWLFVGIFGIMFFIFYWFVGHTAWLKRFFISKREIEEEVEEAAITNFFSHGLYRTRDATGILIYISVFEHKVWVLADHGINEKVPEGQWDEIVSKITNGIKEKRVADAICEAVDAIGTMLQTHFPVKADDTDELRNVIIGQD